MELAFLIGVIWTALTGAGTVSTLQYTECKKTHTVEYCKKQPILKEIK
jgi:hypothetical protein